MTKLIPLKLCGTYSSRSDVGNTLRSSGDTALITRGIPRLLLFRCPCGCGDEVPVNLDSRAGKAWRLFIGAADEKLSLFPSVWRDTGCKSHFVIWNNNILLFDGRYYDEYSAHIEEADIASVERKLSTVKYQSFVDIADELLQVPWYTLEICKLLVSHRRAIESRERGHFKKVKDRR